LVMRLHMADKISPRERLSLATAVFSWLETLIWSFGECQQKREFNFIGIVASTLMKRFVIRFFQYTFACALSSIVAGTIAERTKMMAYLCYSIFLCGKSLYVHIPNASANLTSNSN
jgi:ammonia channel protein AmtB